MSWSRLSNIISVPQVFWTSLIPSSNGEWRWAGSSWPCTHILMGSNSMSRCSDWLKNGDVRKTVTEKLNTESIVWSLGHLTLTRMIEKGHRKQAVYSNLNPISREIVGNIRTDLEGIPAIPVWKRSFGTAVIEASGSGRSMQTRKWQMGQTSFNGHKVARSGKMRYSVWSRLLNWDLILFPPKDTEHSVSVDDISGRGIRSEGWQAERFRWNGNEPTTQCDYIA